MRRLGRTVGLLGAPLLLGGCAWVEQRALDFADCFRFEGQAGYGLLVHANAGELLHAGLGSRKAWTAGIVYGRAESGVTLEDYFPLSIVWTVVDQTQESIHRLPLGEEGTSGTHRCFLLFPGMIETGTVVKPDLHFFDLEAGFLALFVGVEIGFSAGEFLDFLAGLCKFDDGWSFLDPAEDDTPAPRDLKRLWIPRSEKDPLLRPR